MMSNTVFKGRSLSVINDLTVDEQLFLYKKTKELKDAYINNGDLDKFRINDSEAAYYLFFLEDSTRTKESFRNAALFHRGRVNIFDVSTSSFSKMESVTDTIKMLIGYSSKSTFIIRSKIEGLCKWLDIAMDNYCKVHNFIKPVFINAGDGKHEHPTQEILDEFTFLEKKNWDNSEIHLTLLGDLFHGRTVHSKVNGLKIFKKVKIDLVAPKELMMPAHYIKLMKDNNFEVKIYSSIDEYLAQPDISDIWYFTRLQLERMGDEILDKAEYLRTSVTFRKEFIDKLKPNTKFYHPLPRHKEHPTIPTFLDNTDLNGWDEQSVNGYWTRIIEIGLLNGLYDSECPLKKIPEEKIVEDFITDIEVTDSLKKSEYKVGIKPVNNGIVIDHICSGQDVSQIWSDIDKIRRTLKLNVRSSHGVYHRNDRKYYKGIISLPDILSFSEKEIKKLAAISPGCTINFVKDSKITRKLRLLTPPRVYGFDDISCKNENCVSHKNFHEPTLVDFVRTEEDMFKCRYCEKPYKYSEIWDL